MIPVVLDTNTLVSALLTERGNEAACIAAVRDDRIRPCYSSAVLDEYVTVLGRSRFAFGRDRLDRLLHVFSAHGLLVEPAANPPPSPDPSDTPFIARALAGQASFLVTGNRHHFPAPRYGATEVVNARELPARLPPA